MHDMGGMSFFAVTMEQCKGDWELLQCAMDGANKEVDECTHTLPCHHALCRRRIDPLSTHLSPHVCQTTRIVRSHFFLLICTIW
jgi:hypothetical protein